MQMLQAEMDDPPPSLKLQHRRVWRASTKTQAICLPAEPFPSRALLYMFLLHVHFFSLDSSHARFSLLARSVVKDGRKSSQELWRVSICFHDGAIPSHPPLQRSHDCVGPARPATDSHYWCFTGRGSRRV
jgi:hypothetical protein